MMKRNYFLLSILLLLPSLLLAQNRDELCRLEMNKTNRAYVVDAVDAKCLARTSEKDFTLLFTFSDNCPKCASELTEALTLAIKYDIEFFIVLSKKQDSKILAEEISYIKQAERIVNRANLDVKLDLQPLVIKDSEGNPKRKYEKFIRDITPHGHEVIVDMPKYILLSKETADVVAMTNLRDYPNDAGISIAEIFLEEKKQVEASKEEEKAKIESEKERLEQKIRDKIQSDIDKRDQEAKELFEKLEKEKEKTQEEIDEFLKEDIR